MARMWPQVLPDWVLRDIRRKAEIVVFRKLESLLDEDWHVFYSRPWWGISPKGGEIDGEADFIVVHARHGLLFIEVKGGAIGYDPSTEQWSSRDRAGITHRIKDPVKQAIGCKHQFLGRLKRAQGWPHGYVRFRHGVIFPDCEAPDRSMAALGSYNKELFCCMMQFEHALDRWILQRLASHPSNGGMPERGPGEQGIRTLYGLIADPVMLRVPGLREVQGEMATMDMLLTGAQLAVLTMMDQHYRTLVEGGAGTGKTVLAVEAALRHARNGQTVLFCCRSGPLSRHVATQVEGVPGMAVCRFEDLAKDCAWKAGRKMNDPSNAAWDVVVVDEGQDFDWEWWDLIEDLMRTDHGMLRVFADSNQAVYRLRDDLETRLRAVSIPLRINLRNTQSIAKVTECLYRGPLILAPGPKGSAPSLLVCSLDEAIDAGIDAVLRLLREENLDLSMQALLVPNPEIRERVRMLLDRMNIRTTDASRALQGAVVVDTVARFKGLEAPVVTLVADRNLGQDLELSYVGVSRARSRLMVFGPLTGTALFDALSAGN